MKFSIITVCYNAVMEIERTLLSIINQDYFDKEIIVVDGLSTDGTNDIVRKYNKEINIHISERDNGIYDAMNKGLQFATGEYVIFMNAGDCFWNNSVLKQVAGRITNKQIVYYGDTMYDYGEYQELKKSKISRYSITRRNICHQSIFYPRAAIQDYGYDLKYKILSDWNLNIKLFRKSGFEHISLVVSHFYANGISSNTNRLKDSAFIEDLPKMCKQYLGFCPYVFVYFKFKLREILLRNRE